MYLYSATEAPKESINLRRDDQIDPSVWVSPGPREWACIVCTVVISTLAVIFFSLRLWAQQRKKRLFALDNVLLMVASVLLCGLQTTNLLNFLTGYGWDEERPDAALVVYLKTVYAYNILGAIYIALLKISITHLLAQTFFKDSQYLKITMYAIAAIACIGSLCALLAQLLSCNPSTEFWDPMNVNGGGPCNEEIYGNLFYAFSGIGMATELAIFISPFPMLSGMNLSPRRRNGLMILFGFGFICIVIDIINLVLNVIELPDSLSWQIFFIVLYTLAPCLRLMVICACTFKPVVDEVVRIWPVAWSLPGSSSNHSDYEQVEFVNMANLQRQKS